MGDEFGQLHKLQLDMEWLELIKEAQQLGFSFDEIQLFLLQGKATK